MPKDERQFAIDNLLCRNFVLIIMCYLVDADGTKGYPSVCTNDRVEHCFDSDGRVPYIHEGHETRDLELNMHAQNYISD